MMTVDQMQTARLDANETVPSHIVRGMVVDHNDAGYIWVERAGEQWSFRVAMSNRAAVSEHLVDTEVTVCLRTRQILAFHSYIKCPFCGDEHIEHNGSDTVNADEAECPTCGETWGNDF